MDTPISTKNKSKQRKPEGGLINFSFSILIMIYFDIIKISTLKREMQVIIQFAEFILLLIGLTSLWQNSAHRAKGQYFVNMQLALSF
ncbi:hypothetical protein GCM10027037_12130 [Mucilaginibacter koreensis]